MTKILPADIFIFDFDSTLIKIESLDELLIEGLKKNKKTDLIPEIEKITNLGMEGAISLQESIQKRLALAELHQADIQIFQQRVAEEITPLMPALIAWLKKQNHRIYIASGGFLDCILPVAEKLEIDPQNCFGNIYLCDQAGKVIGVDLNNPLVKNTGKTEILKKLKSKHQGKIVMVGDGISDLIPWQEKIADYFLGFGVNKKRVIIQAQAEHYFTTVPDLLDFLKANFTP